jgi:hypothetical protein
MSIFLDNIFSIFGSSVNQGLNNNDDNNNYNKLNFHLEDVQIKDEVLTYYNYLAKITLTINVLMIYFSNAQYEELSLLLTLDLYNKLSVELNNIKYEEDANYENIRKSILLSVQGLLQAKTLYTNLVSSQQNNQWLMEQNSILYDRTKLNEYIQQLMSERSLFPPQSFTLIAATLRPEYAEYIKLYGFPESGIFDMDRLAVILENISL